MQSIAAYQKIVRFGKPLFTTADVAGMLGVGNVHASKILERLAEIGQIIRLKRGGWAIDRGVDPLSIVNLLTFPWPSYVSLQTALYYHEMIEQIPEIIYAVSLSRTHRYETPLGVFSIHRLAPEFFFGFESIGDAQIKMASPEKALLDILYLTTAKTRLFCALPEITLPRGFNKKKIRLMAKRIPALSRQKMVMRRLEKILLPP